MREDCDGSVEEWMGVGDHLGGVAVVQARSNSSELGQVSEKGEDEMNLIDTSEESQQDLETDWTKDIKG